MSQDKNFTTERYCMGWMGWSHGMARQSVRPSVCPLQILIEIVPAPRATRQRLKNTTA